MPDSVLTRDGPVAVPLNYTVPQAGELLPLMVRATLDGSTAASAYYAVVEIVAPSGRVMGKARSDAIAAGASRDVTWFPRLGQGTSAATISVVGARIEMHGLQSVNTSTDTDLTYDTVAFDTAGMANLGADARKLTVTTAGLYMVTCERAWPYQSAARRQISIQHNGFTSGGAPNVCDDSRPAIWATPIGGAGETTCLATTLIDAATGDFFATGANQDSGVSLNTGGGVAEFFSAILLGTV